MKIVLFIERNQAIQIGINKLKYKIIYLTYITVSNVHLIVSASYNGTLHFTWNTLIDYTIVIISVQLFIDKGT